jgi:hypothetical protein
MSTCPTSEFKDRLSTKLRRDNRSPFAIKGDEAAGSRARAGRRGG